MFDFLDEFFNLFFQPILRFFRSMPEAFQYVFVTFFGACLISFCFRILRKAIS